jgi:hypothetical protein
MWRVRQLERWRATLDFSSSGQPSRDVTQLSADGLLFANAVELSDWSERRIQLIVCQDCGIEHCQPGGWLAARRAGTDVVLPPVFADMLEGESGRTEYAPPRYTTDRGVPFFDENTYPSLGRYGAEIPVAQDLPALTGTEFVRCLQWDAPVRVLGSFPDEVALRCDCLLAISEGDLAERVEALQATIHQLLAAEAVAFRPIPPGTTTRTFYLDGRGTPAWPAMAVDAAGTAYIQCEGRLAAPSAEERP